VKATKTYTKLEAKAKMQRLCAKREYCIYDAEEKLFNWGLNRDEVDDVVCDLITDDFINEQRYANAYTHDRIKFSGFGKRKVAFKLGQKRISKFCISKALQYVSDEVYLDTFYACAKTKWESLGKSLTAEHRNKLYAFLNQRGFEGNLIQQFINENLKK